jgi:hypothetical protein
LGLGEVVKEEGTEDIVEAVVRVGKRRRLLLPQSDLRIAR